jgi:hypothetical protein
MRCELDRKRSSSGQVGMPAVPRASVAESMLRRTALAAVVALAACTPPAGAPAEPPAAIDPLPPRPPDNPHAPASPSPSPAAAAPETRELPPELASLPFADLLRLPLVLTYAIADETVACRLSDAGIPDSLVDFAVDCDPLPRWSCREWDAETRAAPAFWHERGCYVVRARGLFYFDTCPTSASAAGEGGVRMLSAKMLDDAPETGTREQKDGTVARRERFAVGSEDIPAICRVEDSGGMGQRHVWESCVSPRYGYLATSAKVSTFDEGRGRGEQVCTASSRLLRVELSPATP